MFIALKNVNIDGIDYIKGDIIDVESVEPRLIRAKKVAETLDKPIVEVVKVEEPKEELLIDVSSDIVVEETKEVESKVQNKKAKK